MGEFLAFPYALDGRGRTARSGLDDHLRDLIVQLLLTDPGERVNRPDFGCGVRRLVFAPNSDALAAATQTLVQASLQSFLEQQVRVEDVQVAAQDDVLQVAVAYSRRDTGQAGVVRVSVPGPGSPP